MRYGSAAAFRQALEARLRTVSRDQGTSLARLRKAVASDRLLARLVAAAPGRWVLKGGLALDYRFGAAARPTRDVDLAMPAGEEAATGDLLAAAALDLGNFFAFTLERTARLDQLLEGSAVRHRVRVDLAGRRFEDFVIDVGFDLPPGLAPEDLVGPDLLGFAGIGPVVAPALPLALQVAEKVHAYSRVYGAGGIGSTRVKDLVDLALIATAARLDAAAIRRAIAETFGRRGRRDVPRPSSPAVRLGRAVPPHGGGDRPPARPRGGPRAGGAAPRPGPVRRGGERTVGPRPSGLGGRHTGGMNLGGLKVARTWLSIRVQLVEGRGERLWPRPGRILAAARSHTFAQLADAIDDAFARWDRAHLHEFELADGTRLPRPTTDRTMSGQPPTIGGRA